MTGWRANGHKTLDWTGITKQKVKTPAQEKCGLMVADKNTVTPGRLILPILALDHVTGLGKDIPL